MTHYLIGIRRMGSGKCHLPAPSGPGNIIRNSKIFCEYDFIQARMLSRSQASSKVTRMRDFDILKSWADGSWE